MSNTEKKPEVVTAEAIDEDHFAVAEETVESVIPSMNVNAPQQTNENQLISDDQYLGVIDEIMSNIREDRKQVGEFIDTFADMVLNDGDATTSTKEALVNLIKTKIDIQDKMLKAADLMTRLKMRNTYANSGPHLNALQQNNINIGTENTNFNRKEIIRAINQAKKKKDK